MAFNFNPVLSEIQGHIQSMSPDAQAVVAKVGGNTLPSAAATAAAQAPSVIPHGMLLPHPDADPEPTPILMGSSTPSLSMPSMPSAAPRLITGPKRGQEMMSNGQSVPIGTTAGDTVERQRLMGEKPGVDNIYHDVTNSSFGQNHPFAGKLLGGLAQVGGKIGDTLANAAPGIAREIPGTTVRHNMLLNQANTALGQDEANAQKQAQAASENATAQHTAAEMPEIAPNAESARGMQGAQKANLESEIKTRENPSEEWKAIPQIIGPNGEPVEIESKSGQVRFGGIQGTQQQKQPKPDSPEQQYIDEYQKLHKGATVAAAERAYTNDTQRPPQAIMLVPGANGGYTAQNVKPGSTVAPNALSTGGLNSMNVPTSQTRAMAEAAPKVIDLANRSEQLIDRQIKSLGPAASRWNEFMAGKIGAPNPEFTKLRTNIGLLQTALMRMHVGARGGEQIMEHFAGLIDSSKQDPQNLKAALDEIKLYAEEVGKSGGNAVSAETDKALGGAAQTQPKANDPLGIR
jgi:hypothetical protein